MSGGMPELGSKISLISKADIRYEGRLYTVDPQECTIALSSVRSFGTEDRETQFQIAPQSQIYDYILFRGSDIKDIRVVNNSLPHPNDPAIMQVQLPNGQHLMPHFPMSSMNPPHAPPMGGAAFGNPFGIGGLAGMGGAGAASSLAPGTGAPAPYMLGNQQQPPQAQQQQQPPQQQKSQQQQQKQPSELLLSSNNNQQQQQQAQPHQQQQQSVHHNASASIIPSKQAQLPNDSSHSLAQIGQLTQHAGHAVGTSDTGIGAGSGGIIVGSAGGGGGSGVGGLLSGLLGSGAVAGLGAVTNAKKLIPHAARNEHKDQDMLAGASRSTTPMSLISRKSPSTDMGVQVNQQPSQPHPNQNNQQQNNAAGHGGNSRDAGHKRQNHQQRGGNRGNNNGNGNGNDFYQQPRDRRDSGRNMDNYNNQHHDTRNSYNNQRNHQGGGGGGGGSGGGGSGGGGQNRGWTMHRGPNNANNMMMRNRGGGGRGRMQNQGYRLMGGPGGNQNKPRNAKNTIKFEQDFDFEQANNKFEELRSQLSKLKVGEEPKSEQMNGEVDKKDDSGNETGAGEHEPEDEEITVGYDKTKSFFDNISCEAAQDRTKNKKNDWRQERKLNSETFGVSSTRRGSYRGRGNYYNRNVGNYGGGYNRNYRGGNNYRNRTRNANAANSNNGAASTTNTTAAAAANGSNNAANGTASTNTASALKNQAQQQSQSAASASGTAGGAVANATKSTPSESSSTPQQISAGGAGQ